MISAVGIGLAKWYDSYTVDIIEDALSILDKPENFTIGTKARDKDDHPICFNSPNAVKFSAEGAIKRCFENRHGKIVRVQKTIMWTFIMAVLNEHVRETHCLVRNLDELSDKYGRLMVRWIFKQAIKTLKGESRD